MKLLLAMVVAAVLGGFLAWRSIYQEYGRRDAYFGLLDLEGEVTVASLQERLIDLGATSLAKAEFPEGNVYDFGVMEPGAKGEHVFIVKNTGEAPLSLKIGASTCKCTIGSLAKDEIAPGQEAEIKLEWTVSTNRDSFEQTAELLTNDPSQPAVQLKIQGRVVEGIDIVPQAWTFGEVAAGDPIEVTGKIYNYMEYDIEPRQIAFSGEMLRDRAEIECEPFTPGPEDGIHSEARQGFRIVAKVPPGLPQGAVQQNLNFGFVMLDESGEVVPVDPTDPNKISFATASVTGNVVGVLSMIPSSKVLDENGQYIFQIGHVDLDDLEHRAFIRLKGTESDKTRLSISESEPAGVVEASLEEPTINSGTALYRLKVKLNPGPEPISKMGVNREGLGWVKIESDNPDVSGMRIIVRFALPAK